MTAITENDIPFIDVVDKAFRFDQAAIHFARERHWYAETAMGPMVLRYEDVAAVLADRRLSPTGSGHLAVHGISSGPIYDYFSINMSSRASADHGKLRSLLAPYLSPRRLDEARARAGVVIDDLMPKLADRPETDFMSEFADPLAIRVFCELLGLPVDEVERFAPWSADVGLVFGLTLVGLRDRLEEDLRNLFAYFEDLLERRRRHPGDDFVSKLVATQQEHGISQAQCLSTLVSLIMGGHDAPMHQLGCAVATLARHPDQWRLLATQPHLGGRAVEEALRWSAHTHTMRFAQVEFDYRGLVLAPGDLVITGNTAANYDPRAFEEPDRFDIAAVRSNQAIAFGGGPYFCPGNGLARMEMEAALVALTQTFEPPEIIGEIGWRPATTTALGPETLPLRWEPKRPT